MLKYFQKQKSDTDERISYIFKRDFEHGAPELQFKPIKNMSVVTGVVTNKPLLIFRIVTY
jgi:hypothetical protein